MRTLRTTSLLLFLFISTQFDAAAQDLHPSRRLSPLGMARSFVGDTYVKITYGRPYVRGRDNIFGEASADVMHPNGQIWRFGANEPTELTFDGAVKVGDARVEAGTYSVFATPGATSWTIHLNDLRGGDAEAYDAEKNVVSLVVPEKTLDEAVDQFTIAFEEAGAGVHMVASWTDWEIRVPIMPAD